MTQPYLETLKETFAHPEAFSAEKLQSLVGETMEYFQNLQQKFQSEDPKEREKAMDAALEMKEALEAQMESLCQSLGIDPSQLAQVAKEFSKTEEEKVALKAMKEQFGDEKEKARSSKKKTVNLVV